MSDADKLWAVDSALAAAYLQVKAAFEEEHPGSRLTVAQGFRTPVAQASAASVGASPFNGTTSWSFHQSFPSKAIDVAVIDANGYVSNGGDGRYSWVGHRFEAFGIIWGGRFHSRPDYDHAQTAGHGPRSAQEAAAALAAYETARAARSVTA